MARGTPLSRTCAEQPAPGLPRGHRAKARRARGAYYNLGASLANSAHYVEGGRTAVPRGQGALPGGLGALGKGYGRGLQHAGAGGVRRGGQAGVHGGTTREGLKALSVRVVRAAPDNGVAIQMRAVVLAGNCRAWEAGPRSAAELREAATHFERAAALEPAPAMKTDLAGQADWCRRRAQAM